MRRGLASSETGAWRQKQLGSRVPRKRQSLKDRPTGDGKLEGGTPSFLTVAEVTTVKTQIVPWEGAKQSPHPLLPASAEGLKVTQGDWGRGGGEPGEGLLQEGAPGPRAAAGIRGLLLSPACPPHPPVRLVVPLGSWLWNKGRGHFHFPLYCFPRPKPPHGASAAFVPMVNDRRGCCPC